MSQSNQTVAPTQGNDRIYRLESLDALRGADMLFIMGFGTLLVRLCRFLGFGGDCLLASQLTHVAWNGLHFEDMIFPIFLFVAGVSFPYSMSKQLERGRSRGGILLRCAKRMAVLFVLGLFYGGFFSTLDPSSTVFGSVLGRIGIAWFLAAVLYLFCGTRTRVAVAAFILVGYWMLLLHVPAPDAASVVVPDRLAAYAGGPFSPAANFAGYLDRLILPGKLTVPGVISNQGLLSTAPSVVTAMLGMFTGEFLRGRGGTMSGGRRTLALLLAAAALIALGSLVAFGCGGWSMPFNKILWSTSFTLAVGGVALSAFAIFHYLIDVRGWRRWAFAFRVIGLNSITIYLLQRLVDFDAAAKMFVGGFARFLPDYGEAVLASAGHVVLCWLVLWFLYRNKVFLKV